MKHRYNIHLFVIIGILVMPNLYGQYFSKAYFSGDNANSFGTQILKNGNNSIALVTKGGNGVSQFVFEHDIQGEIIKKIQHEDTRGHWLTVQKTNDTLLIASSKWDEAEQLHWRVKVTNTQGDSLDMYDYNVFSLKSYYRLTLLYGLCPAGKDEWLLWGQGFDPNNPDTSATNLNNQSKIVLLRIKTDGTQIGEISYFEHIDDDFGTNVVGSPYDAWQDIDGNMVYVFEPFLQNWRYIYKIYKDGNTNERQRLFKVASTVPPTNSSTWATPAIHIDSAGYYYMTSIDSKPLGSINYTFDNVQKYDRNYQQVWKADIDLGTENKGYQRFIKSVKTCKNGDVIVCGYAHVYDTMYIASLDSLVPVVGYNGGFVSRISQSGQVLWNRVFVGWNDAKEYRENWLWDIAEMEDGSIVVTGGIYSDKSADVNTEDFWIMRISANGCFDETCSDELYLDISTTISTHTKPLPAVVNAISVYPNPGYEALQFELPPTIHGPIKIQLVDTYGRSYYDALLSGQMDSYQSIHTSLLPQGLYLLTLSDQEGHRWQAKWVKSEG